MQRSTDRSRTRKRNLKAMWFDTILQDARALAFVATQVGAERLMLGSDYPFPIGDLQPRAAIGAAGFDAAASCAIEGTTAQRIFGL